MDRSGLALLFFFAGGMKLLRLVIIMTGATAITVLGGGSASALVPLIVGLLSGSVAYGPVAAGIVAPL